MTNDDFEWDDEKAAANLARHGVSFELACKAFDDPSLSTSSTIAKITASKG